MANSTYFSQGCPTCGRRLNIRVEYLGKRVICEHCHGQFVARDPSSSPIAYEGTESELLQRANQLLQALDSQAPQRRGHVPR